MSRDARLPGADSAVSTDPIDILTRRMDGAEEGLLTCVHCGFCLPACPTYRELGDEADSPRGRLHLMRAVAEGRLDPASEAFQTHIDRCLGCRACEPVCPSGVPYGSLLESARQVARSALPARKRTAGRVVEAMLAVFRRPIPLRLVLAGARVARSLRLPSLARRVAPGGKRGDALRFAASMLQASGGRRGKTVRSSRRRPSAPPRTAGASVGPRVALLPGCVQGSLFERVVDASERVLARNGCVVTRMRKGGCCGALHAHAGDHDGAVTLARHRIAEAERMEVDIVATDAAGCGAAMKEYVEWFGADPEWADRAAAFSAKVRDVTEVLAERGPMPGGELRRTVAFDPPCHLRHAQRADGATGKVLAAIPGLEVRTVADPDACCGGAGIYGVTHPELGGAVGERKVSEVRATGATCVATGNPGCMMQIGAGLILAGSGMEVVHPVELLDESYALLEGPG
jgi:glycolate oxidase iron-sulfur subunit